MARITMGLTLRRTARRISRLKGTFEFIPSAYALEADPGLLLLSYSARNVRSGSRVAARHAGRALATAPITNKRAPALKYVKGSLLLTP